MSDVSQMDFPRRLFTVDEVSQMVDRGILDEDEPVELLDGELVLVSPQHPEHAATIAALARRLSDAYRENAHVRPQVPLDARPYNLPEPDLAVVPGEPNDYRKRHPRAAEALLVIEVARTRQGRAMARRKARIYAAAGARVYWWIDLAERQVEVFREPSPDGAYAERRVLGPGEELALPGLDLRLAVSELVG